MVEGMPNMGQLNEVLDQLKKMQDPLLQKQKEQMEMAVKLQAVAQSQKSIKINGTDVLVQLYDGDVRVVFPTKELTKHYYDTIEITKADKQSWFKRLLKKWLK